MLCCILPGFLQLTVMLLGSLVGRWRLAPVFRLVVQFAFHSSRKTPSRTSPSFPILGTRLCFEKPLCISAALLRQRNTCTLVLPMEAFQSLNTQDKSERLTAATGHLLQGHDGQLPTIIRMVLLAVFMTVDNAGTPWHPQFFRSVTFKSQRLTQDSHMVYPRHSDVRIGEPREPALLL